MIQKGINRYCSLKIESENEIYSNGTEPFPIILNLYSLF